MRASRALFASLGASLSLVLAGSLALATISTVVAFQGWPGVASGKRAAAEPQLRVAAVGRASTTQAVALRVPHRARPTQPRRRPTSAAARTTLRTPARRIATRATGTTATQAHTGAAPAAMAMSAGAATTTRKPPKRVSVPSAEPVREIGNNLGGAVAGAGKGLGDAVANISPELGNVVKDVTGGLGTTVAGATQLVADVVDALTGAKKTPPGRR